MARHLVGNKHGFCLYCRSIKPVQEFAVNNSACTPCARINRKRAEQVSNQRAIAKAAKDLSRALSESKHARDAADMPTIINRFKEKLGGAEGVADMLVDDFRTARGDNIPPEADFRRNETLVQKYHTMFLRAIQAKDDALANAADLSHLDEEDLKATLVGLARELIETDDELRAQLVTEVLSSDPTLVTVALKSIGIEVVDDGAVDNETAT